MGRGFQSGMGGFGGINMNQLMKQAKKMQEEMEKTQEDLGSKVFAISVKANGKKQILEIKLEKDVVDPDDVEMLEDLIMTCINDVMSKVDSASNAEFGKYNIPGLGL